MRSDHRTSEAIRKVTLETGVSEHAEGSCLIQAGRTRVLCTASVEERVPPHIRGTGKGWITAEYGMLPRSTHSRMDRKRTADSGRSQEISRLIGRSLRAACALDQFGERQIIVDCDVLQADGGTRTAAITGGYVALALAFDYMAGLSMLNGAPIHAPVAAISCGVVKGDVLCDLDYSEDSAAEVDANFIMTHTGGIVEIQVTGEGGPFADRHLTAMLDYARDAINMLGTIQNKALAGINHSAVLKNP